MTAKNRKPFAIRAHWTPGGWYNETYSFHKYAVQQLKELELLVQQGNSLHPLPLGQALKQPNAPPELWELASRQKFVSDSIRIYAAMAVEGFLNFYGVVRLGEEEFTCHFEKLGLIPKLRLLLLICDSISISNTDPLVKPLEHIAASRNSLVHPKAREIRFDLPEQSLNNVRIPDAAREIITDMNVFFHEFLALVPDASHLLPNNDE
ncbi:hypothetical protein [Candidatus Ferrigenium straubiae]|jgi:hypothetical protein|uniref:hypothetical protein n=1 Tax=Candidatus Ferrigenium straubiae TaxID=2919506 RepID=UPI003F4AF292